ncbi:hypothetical protein [Streptomyces sp. NPDC127038]|uniref:VMAP-C domain-containing protein n=1 Tax=Streptomyces sp. NPDC127038 TaxID=3347114 RepID=UPI0036654EF5
MGLASSRGPLAAAAASSLLSAMADVLNRSPHFATPSNRQDLVRYLVRTLEEPFTGKDLVPARSFDHFTHIVSECTRHSEGTDVLAEAVASLDGDRRTALAMRLLADQWTARDQLTEDDLSLLDGLLGRLSIEHDVRAVARASMQPVSAPLPAHCTDARSILLYLLRRNARPDGLPPFLAFLEFLAAAAKDPVTTSLREWTEQRARRHALLPALQSCRARAEATQVVPSKERRMMLVLLPDGLEDDYFALRVWHQDDAQHRTPALRDNDARVRGADLERAIRGRLREATGSRDNGAPLTIEFWLPLSLINLPVDDWCVPRDPAEPGDVRVVVRSLDRMQTSASHRSSWRERWTRMVGPAADNGKEDQPGGPAERRQEVPCVLTAPPDCDEGRVQLLEAINSGVPVVLWHRHDCTSTAFRTTVDGLLSHGPVAELPERIGRMRVAYGIGEAQSDVVRGLTLMWDDPDRSLPALNPLVAPDEVAAP